MFFETKVTYQGIKLNGGQGKCSAPYLIDAVSFAEAEELAFKFTEADNISDIKVATAKKSPIVEVITNEVDGTAAYYKASVVYQDLDSSKAIRVEALTLAKDVKQALFVFLDHFSEYLCDTELVKLEKSPIVHVLIKGTLESDESEVDTEA